MFHAPFTDEDPSFTPGVREVDPQFLSLLELLFALPLYEVNHPIGTPSPTSQYVLAQGSFFSMGSPAPSGASALPASFYHPPPHPAGLSASHFNQPQSDHRPAMPSAPSARVDIQVRDILHLRRAGLIVFRLIQSVSVPRVGPKSDVLPPYTVPALRQERISGVPLNVYPPEQWFCPLCQEPSRRRQDRDRHLHLHLPFWLACSYDSCNWRGYRLDAFRRHWRSEHQSSKQVPDESGSKLYDPAPLVKGIVGNPLSIGHAIIWAVAKIKEKAAALNKQGLLTDPWGRNGMKKFQGPRQEFHFSEKRNALPISATTSSTTAFSSVSPAKLATHPYPNSSRPKKERRYS